MPNLQKWLILPDQHIPYNDKRYWKLIIQVGRKMKPHGILILGDFLDFYPISFHSKDPKRRGDLHVELLEANRHLDELDSLRAKDKRYQEGNHEFRLQRFIQEKAPELHTLIPTVPEALGLTKRGWQFTPYKSNGRIGHFRYTHDVGASGAYAHYKAGQAFQKSNGTGHTHRAGLHYFGTIEGETKVSGMFGWGGNKEAADYANETQKKDWVLAFGWGHSDPRTGIMYVNLIPLVDYSCVVDGNYFFAPFTKGTGSKRKNDLGQII